MKRIERAIAIVVSSRGDMMYPESESELEFLIDNLKAVGNVLVFRKHREYLQDRPLPTRLFEELP